MTRTRRGFSCLPVAMAVALATLLPACEWTLPPLLGPVPGSPYRCDSPETSVRPPFVTMALGGQACLRACFAGDRDRDNEDRVRWRSADRSIVTVDPATGIFVDLRGVGLGETKVIVDVLGVTIDVPVQVLTGGEAPAYVDCS